MAETTPEPTVTVGTDSADAVTVQPVAEDAQTPAEVSTEGDPLATPEDGSQAPTMGDTENAPEPAPYTPPAPGASYTFTPAVGKRQFVGPIETTLPNTTEVDGPSAEQAYHDLVRSASVPGDAGYSAHTDPLVKSSHTADVIMTEVKGLGHSPFWQALKDDFESWWANHVAKKSGS